MKKLNILTTLNKKIAVYTVIIGNYDCLKVPKYFNLLKKQADFFCFTDQKLTSEQYKIIRFSKKFENPTKTSRYPKINSHEYFQNYEYSIYLDGSFKLICKDLNSLIKKYIAKGEIIRFKHPERNCLYEEGMICLEKKLDSKNLIENQLNRYRANGFPKNFGLGANGFIIRKNTTEVTKFNQKWWDEYINNSKRDQLSFDYARWCTNIKIVYIEKSYFNGNGIVVKSNHHDHREPSNFMKAILNLIKKK